MRWPDAVESVEARDRKSARVGVQSVDRGLAFAFSVGIRAANTDQCRIISALASLTEPRIHRQRLSDTNSTNARIPCSWYTQCLAASDTRHKDDYCCLQTAGTPLMPTMVSTLSSRSAIYIRLSLCHENTYGFKSIFSTAQRATDSEYHRRDHKGQSRTFLSDIFHPQRSQFVRFLSPPESAINCYPRERRVACSTHAEDPFRRASRHAVPIYHSWRLFRNSARPMENFHRLAPRIPVPWNRSRSSRLAPIQRVVWFRFNDSFLRSSAELIRSGN